MFTYYIEGCPIPFHGLVEIFEYLKNLPVVLLYQYQFLLIYIENKPLMWIILHYDETYGYRITYLAYR